VSKEDRGDSFVPTDDDVVGTADEKSEEEELLESVLGKKEDTTEEISDEDKAAAEEAAAAARERNEKGQFTKGEKKGVIPLDRHESVLSKERAARETAEAELAAMRAQMAEVSKAADVTKLEEQIMELRKADRKAIMKGDEDESVRLGTEIDRLNRQIIIQQSESMSAIDKESAREEIRTELAVEKLQGIYPVLDENSEAFDQQLVDFVLAEQGRLIREARMSPSKALTKAANDIIQRLSPPAAADEGGKKGLAAATKSTDRKAVATQKGIDAAKKTPASTKDVGIDSDKAGIKDDIDVEKLSYEEFEALPAATKSRLRGDMA
jgi:hypothetical protein